MPAGEHYAVGGDRAGGGLNVGDPTGFDSESGERGAFPYLDSGLRHGERVSQHISRRGNESVVRKVATTESATGRHRRVHRVRCCTVEPLNLKSCSALHLHADVGRGDVRGSEARQEIAELSEAGVDADLGALGEVELSRPLGEVDCPAGAALASDDAGRAAARALSEPVLFDHDDAVEAALFEEPGTPSAYGSATDDDSVRGVDWVSLAHWHGGNARID
jgi:hypothetical protein